MRSWHVERVSAIGDRFETITRIGGGTYGIVEKCFDMQTKSVVAVKKIVVPHPGDGCPFNTIREVRVLVELRHDNIIRLRSVVQTDIDLFLVFDYCEYDVFALLHFSSIPEVDTVVMKSLMKQFMVALQCCAVHRIIHRDLKPANMFVTKKGILKLGDFGLARHCAEQGPMTFGVITLWYRPPELLLESKAYGPEVDIWSAGCILYEMATSKVLFRCDGKGNNVTMLMTIFTVCGVPTDEEWPGFRRFQTRGIWKSISPSTLPHKSQLLDILNRDIPKEYEGLTDLIMMMLQYDPMKRITAEMALKHPFFRDMDRETEPVVIPPLRLKEMHQMLASENREKVRRERKEAAKKQ